MQQKQVGVEEDKIKKSKKRTNTIIAKYRYMVYDRMV